MASGTFDCTVCFDDKPLTDRVAVTVEDAVCADCVRERIVPLFEEALKHEHAYPVTWGAGVSLRPEDFVKFLPTGFTIRYLLQEREYRTPAKERVYCYHLVLSDGSSGGRALLEQEIEAAVDNEQPMQECNKFLGALAPMTGARVTRVCKCGGATCGMCGSSFFGLAHEHECSDADDGCTMDDPFKGLVKGRDYQQCPKCDVKCELRDGCNLILCTQPACGASFCFICGKQVDRRETGHFKKASGCPRWNQPGADNAHFDTNVRREILLPFFAAENPIAAEAFVAVVGVHNHAARILEAAGIEPQGQVAQAEEPEGEPRREPSPMQRLFAFTATLEQSLRDQWNPLRDFTNIPSLSDFHLRYWRNNGAIENAAPKIEDFTPMAQRQSVRIALDYYRRSRSGFNERLAARANVLREEERARNPPWLDLSVFEHVKASRDVVDTVTAITAIARTLLRSPAASRTEHERAYLRLAEALRQGFLEQSALQEIAFAGPVQVKFGLQLRGSRAVIDRELEVLRSAGLNLSLNGTYQVFHGAVELFRKEHDTFDKKLEARIMELKAVAAAGGEAGSD